MMVVDDGIAESPFVMRPKAPDIFTLSIFNDCEDAAGVPN
jgi:hypothetical protein